MAISTARVDTTFLAWWREYGMRNNQIGRALQRTRDQIGPPMPANYVPPPLRYRGDPHSLKDLAKGRPELGFLTWEPGDKDADDKQSPVAVPVKLVSRIVYQEFSDASCSNSGSPGPPDIGRDALKTLIGGALRYSSGGHRAFVYGTENKSARRTRMVPANHVLTKVISESSVSNMTEGFASCEFSSLALTYTWGPHTVSVNVVKKSEAKALGVDKKWHDEYNVPREQLDTDLQPSD
jgi:hypothetical protein